MRPPRNPFHFRVVEKIESDDTFLQLFQSSSLDVFDPDKMWDRLHIIRSAQGGGKTSLLRLFTPACVWRVWRDRESSSLGDLYNRMEQLGAFSSTGPAVLGIVVACSTPYNTLEHLEVGDTERLYLFNALVDARCIAEAIKGTLELRGLSADQNLHRVKLSEAACARLGISAEADGTDLLRWARNVEENIWGIIDEGDPEIPEGLGHHRLEAMQLLERGSLTFDGQATSFRVLISFDDVHKLGQSQRSYLIEHAATSRPKCAVWIAERLQAVQPHELISVGASSGREFEEFNLAHHWKEVPPKVFAAIANARMASTSVLDKFADILNDPVDSPREHANLRAAHETLTARLTQRTKGQEIFRDLDIHAADDPPTLYNELIRLKAAEIIIERYSARYQPSLDMAEGLPLPKKEDLRDIRAASEYQACQEFKLPYYFGLDNIAKLSSANIDQFLDVAGDIFEEVLALRVVNKRPPITARRQEQVVLEVARRKWEDIPKRVVEGSGVQSLLKGFATFAVPLSMNRRASYAPGVTGFAISPEDHARISDPRLCAADPVLAQVSSVLSRCVAHNVLYMTNRLQGTKGSSKTVFYLNRLLCAHLGLPLGYGGWRLRTVDQLADWITKGRGNVGEDGVLDLFGVEAQ